MTISRFSAVDMLATKHEGPAKWSFSYFERSIKCNVLLVENEKYGFVKTYRFLTTNNVAFRQRETDQGL